MGNELMQALDLLKKEKNIDTDQLLEALKHSLVSAYKKHYNAGEDVNVEISDDGKIVVRAGKKVVETPEDEQNEISLEEAKEISPKYEVGDTVYFEATPKNFGLIAIQNAKQMVIQHIREAERGTLYAEYHEKENDIINGTIKKLEKKGVLIEIGKTETLLTAHEQIPGEVYTPGKKLMVYVLEVKNTSKGVQILVSRTHPGLVRRLFEREVPEIADGTVEIKSVSREAGSRTKIAVYSNNKSVDPVGACVGQKGARVNSVLECLGNEKVDIIKYSDDPAAYISESLSPAKVISVTVNEEEKSAEVVVPEFQLSLAIGKEGQNARLAAKLTGWKIDIKSDKQAGLSFTL